MALTPEQRAILEWLGPELVRQKLLEGGGTGSGAALCGFETTARESLAIGSPSNAIHRKSDAPPGDPATERYTKLIADLTTVYLRHHKNNWRRYIRKLFKNATCIWNGDFAPAVFDARASQARRGSARPGARGSLHIGSADREQSWAD
jgi:hypothetical protein